MKDYLYCLLAVVTLALPSLLPQAPGHQLFIIFACAFLVIGAMLAVKYYKEH